MTTVRQAQREVVTDMALTCRTVKGVTVNRITRVAPQQNEVDMAGRPYLLGNAAHGEETTFIVECTLPERSIQPHATCAVGTDLPGAGSGFPG